MPYRISGGIVRNRGMPLNPPPIPSTAPFYFVLSGTTVRQTDYQFSITVNYGTGCFNGNTMYCNSMCNPYFSDLYFRDQYREPLDFWIETFTPYVNATVWVKLNDIRKYPEGATVYAYFGTFSPYASQTIPHTSGVYGSLTFPELFDHFDYDKTMTWNGTFTDIWYSQIWGGGTVKTLNSSLVISSLGGYTIYNARAISHKVMPRGRAFRALYRRSQPINLLERCSILYGLELMNPDKFSSIYDNPMYPWAWADSANRLLNRYGHSISVDENIHVVEITSGKINNISFGKVESPTEQSQYYSATYSAVIGNVGLFVDEYQHAELGWALVRKFEYPEPEASISGVGVPNRSAYSKDHTITNSTLALEPGATTIVVYASNGTDSENTVYLGYKCRNDFKDIVWKCNGSSVGHFLAGYVEGVSATFYVGYNSFPALSTMILTVCYGGGYKTTGDGSCFLFFDNFDSTVLNTNNWCTPLTFFVGRYGISNSSFYISATNTVGAYCELMSCKYPPSTNIEVVSKIRYSSVPVGYYSCVLARQFYNTIDYYFEGIYLKTDYYFEFYEQGQNRNEVPIGLPVDTLEHVVKLVNYNYSSFTAYVDANQADATGHTLWSYGSISSLRLSLRDKSAWGIVLPPHTLFCDWIFANRRYATPQITHGGWGEETTLWL